MEFKMYELFIEFITMAAFFALHGLIVLGLIFLGLTLHAAGERFFERQRQKAMEMFYKNQSR